MAYVSRIAPQETSRRWVVLRRRHETTRVEVASIDLDAGRVAAKVGPKRPPPPARVSLIPGVYINAVEMSA